ncbi:MAG: gluconate 2-dehydrogenase subunit 3 family protein, partial [Acidobacteriota bacterium]|nr:gluconate 2-dehydrogenase subunit 3 family protein [Acidobacteriota bacterium]
HAIEGMFCDPLHGGNAGMIGWRMIDYPGPVMTNRGDIEKYRGVELPKREPKSLEQIAGRPVRGWEDEK